MRHIALNNLTSPFLRKAEPPDHLLEHELHSQMKLPLDVHRKMVYNLSVDLIYSYIYFTTGMVFCKEAVPVFLYRKRVYQNHHGNDWF